jgi:hypothetical protein
VCVAHSVVGDGIKDFNSVASVTSILRYIQYCDLYTGGGDYVRADASLQGLTLGCN